MSVDLLSSAVGGLLAAGIALGATWYANWRQDAREARGRRIERATQQLKAYATVYALVKLGFSITSRMDDLGLTLVEEAKVGKVDHETMRAGREIVEAHFKTLMANDARLANYLNDHVDLFEPNEYELLSRVVFISSVREAEMKPGADGIGYWSKLPTSLAKKFKPDGVSDDILPVLEAKLAALRRELT